MAHEQSVTFEIDGKAYNFPSVVDGKKVSDDIAVEVFKKKLNKKEKIEPWQGPFETIKEAVDAAKKRSKSFDGTPLDPEFKKRGGQ